MVVYSVQPSTPSMASLPPEGLYAPSKWNAPYCPRGRRVGGRVEEVAFCATRSFHQQRTLTSAVKLANARWWRRSPARVQLRVRSSGRGESEGKRRRRRRRTPTGTSSPDRFVLRHQPLSCSRADDARWLSRSEALIAGGHCLNHPPTTTRLWCQVRM